MFFLVLTCFVGMFIYIEFVPLCKVFEHVQWEKLFLRCKKITIYHRIQL